LWSAITWLQSADGVQWRDAAFGVFVVIFLAAGIGFITSVVEWRHEIESARRLHDATTDFLQKAEQRLRDADELHEENKKIRSQLERINIEQKELAKDLIAWKEETFGRQS